MKSVYSDHEFAQAMIEAIDKGVAGNHSVCVNKRHFTEMLENGDIVRIDGGYMMGTYIKMTTGLPVFFAGEGK